MLKFGSITKQDNSIHPSIYGNYSLQLVSCLRFCCWIVCYAGESSAYSYFTSDL